MKVEKWFELENSSKLENQVKYYIATSVEGYLNGCYNDNYEPMTENEWIEYVYAGFQMDKDTVINGHDSKHLNFIGREKFEELTKQFIRNYDNAKEYTKLEV